jgi:hypothetical protein
MELGPGFLLFTFKLPRRRAAVIARAGSSHMGLAPQVQVGTRASVQDYRVFATVPD